MRGGGSDRGGEGPRQGVRRAATEGREGRDRGREEGAATGGGEGRDREAGRGRDRA